jgi:hypothetical protein
MDEAMALMERFEVQKTRLQSIVGLMHHNHSIGCDVDGLEKLVDAVDRVVFRKERIAVTTAQGAAALARKLALTEAERAEAGLEPEEVEDQAEDPPTDGEPDPAEPAAPAETLVLKQAPPIAKPGRTRGWVSKDRRS